MTNRFSRTLALLIVLAASTSNVQRTTHFALASTVDLALDSHSISFSEETLYAGDEIRVYARVKNIGDVDASAYVLFYQGGMLIGTSQAVSLPVGGNPDDVFVDFTVPTGSFNIRAVLQGSSPQDQNPANDATQTALYYPIADNDRDAVVNEEDNCVNHENADQLDTDGDEVGDVCDSDDDGDGVSDENDAYPLDSTKSSDPAAIVITTPVTTTQAPEPSAETEAESSSQTPFESNTSSSSDASSTSTGADASGSETSDATSDTTTDIQPPTAASASSTSRLTTSPLARFSWKQIDWRTYEFTLADQPEERVQFGWDFGDGTTSAQPQIVHAFSGPGTYTVTLAILDEHGNMLSDAQTFDITFFHLDNPQVIGLIILLFIALFSFGFAFIKLRSPYDQDAAHK